MLSLALLLFQGLYTVFQGGFLVWRVGFQETSGTPTFGGGRGESKTFCTNVGNDLHGSTEILGPHFDPGSLDKPSTNRAVTW